MIENVDEFVAFLVEAKRKTYPGGGPHAAPSRPASTDLHFQNGPYLYIDTFLGGTRFAGEEAVWVDGRPVWAMNYCGHMTVSETPEGFGRFLDQALLSVPSEAPYRGPAYLQHEKFEYRCTWQGDLHDFHGSEEILADGRTVYTLLFHGGSIA